jgi:outer membrane protein assembly complex protein YaeT
VDSDAQRGRYLRARYQSEETVLNRLLLALCLLAWVARPGDAAPADYLGKPIVEVHVTSNGVEVRDPTLLEVVETRRGSPLTMLAVRETLAHLYGLGRYRDVQVDAALRGDSVVLTYNLVPAQRVRRIVFEGSLGLPESELQRLVIDRHGASPSLARAPLVVSTLQTLYRDRGYPRAVITARAVPDRDPASASLVLSIEPGLRATIDAIDVQAGQRAAAVPADLLRRLDLRSGAEYDGMALDASLARYADELRGQGYYEARLAHFPRFVNDDRNVNLVISLDQGPRVEVVFQGDVLTAREREQLVPIAREHSVDEDLLEDSKFGIERHFRSRGYCNPRADYQRNAVDGVLRIVFNVAHGLQCVVETMDITGNSAISSVELTPLIQTKAGQPFNESALGADAARIQGLYRQRGFASVKVTSRNERGEVVNGVAHVRVRMEIAEGPRSVVQSVTFDGNSAFESETLRQSITSAPGRPYFEPEVASDADALSVLYVNRGYPGITIQPQPSLAADKAGVDLRFLIREGPQIIVDHVLIVGNQRTNRDTIAREVRFKRGQPLSQQDEDDTRAGITALGLFRRVDIAYLQLPGVLNHRDVIITVDEALVTTIGYGGGLEGGKRTVVAPDGSGATEEFQVAPRGFFEVSRRNLFGKDRTLNLFTRVSFAPANNPGGGGGYGFNEYVTRLTYAERRVFNTVTDATISGGVEQARRPSFDFNRRGASVTLTRRLGRTLAVNGRYTIDNTRLLRIRSDDFAQQDIDRLFPQVRLSSVSSSLIRDTRSDSIEPNAGSLVGLDVELAARAIGSEVGFAKSFVQGFAFRRLSGSGIVGAFGGRLGLANGFPRLVIEPGQIAPTLVEDIPASERFYAGGDTTVRGFALDRLGPLDASGFPIGGHSLMIFNAELRIPLRGSFGAVAFVDAGNVFLRIDDMDLGELRGSYGFGIRYRSPVGPIRVDVGVKMDRRMLPNGTREKPTALHISLGQAF